MEANVPVFSVCLDMTGHPLFDVLVAESRGQSLAARRRGLHMLRSVIMPSVPVKYAPPVTADNFDYALVT